MGSSVASDCASMRHLHEDRSLLQAFRRGDAEALAHVYRAHVQRLAQYLRAGFATDAAGSRFTGLARACELEDAVQEVFVRAFRDEARRSYDGVRPFEGWLLGIAHNYVISELRPRRLPIVPLTAELGQQHPAGVSTDAEVEDRELDALVKAFVTTLDPRETGVYRARFEKQLSQEQAAQALGLTRIQVRRAEVRLKSRLLSYLQQQGYLSDYPAARLRNSLLSSILF